jgi:putative membrane protein
MNNVRGTVLAWPAPYPKWGCQMKKQCTRLALVAAAIWGLSGTAFAQQSSGTTRGQTGHGGTETRGQGTETRGSTQSTSRNQSTATAQLSSADQSFVKEAALGGLAEVQLGRLATEKASSADVKQFGQRMVDDHGKANEQLSTIAQQKNVQIPTELTGKAKADYDRLSKLSGEPFDRAYMQLMVQDHRKDVAEFRKQSTSAKDSDLKSFASQTLPTLEEHLKMAQQTQLSLGGARATSGKSGTSTTAPKGTGGTTTTPRTPNRSGGTSSGTPDTPPSPQR